MALLPTSFRFSFFLKRRKLVERVDCPNLLEVFCCIVRRHDLAPFFDRYPCGLRSKMSVTQKTLFCSNFHMSLFGASLALEIAFKMGCFGVHISRTLALVRTSWTGAFWTCFVLEIAFKMGWFRAHFSHILAPVRTSWAGAFWAFLVSEIAFKMGWFGVHFSHILALVRTSWAGAFRGLRISTSFSNKQPS